MLPFIKRETYGLDILNLWKAKEGYMGLVKQIGNREWFIEVIFFLEL